MKISEVVLGRKISCEVRQADYTKYFGKSITDASVQYDGASDIITVDERASNDYTKFAAIHECICCGKFADLVPEGNDKFNRCAKIDKLIMDLIPEDYRTEYSRKRFEMFKTLIEKGLNPNLNESFKHSLEFHKNFLNQKRQP